MGGENGTVYLPLPRFQPKVNSFGPELGSSLKPRTRVKAMPEFASMDLIFVWSSTLVRSSLAGSAGGTTFSDGETSGA